MVWKLGSKTRKKTKHKLPTYATEGEVGGKDAIELGGFRKSNLGLPRETKENSVPHHQRKHNRVGN